MKRIILIFSIIFILFLNISVISAGDNSTQDIISAGDLTFDTVQDSINSSSEFGVVILDGTYESTGSPITVNKPITIKGSGNGSKLNGKSTSQILNIQADNVVLENLLLVGGTTDNDYSLTSGGAVCNKGSNLKIINCSFINNFADYGGAISSEGENVSIINCHFSSNTAQYSGGAFELDGNNNYVDNCVFTDNYAGHVGASVAWVGSDGLLSNSIFSYWNIPSSKVTQYGGAVVWMGARGQITQCSFYGAHAKKYGAAVYWKGENGSLNYCIFDDNYSPNDLAYWGNPDNLEYNYWALNMVSQDNFTRGKLVYFNSTYAAPKTWVNIESDSEGVKFISNDGSELNKYLPDYTYNNIKLSKNSYKFRKSTYISCADLRTYAAYGGKSLEIVLKDNSGKSVAKRTVLIKVNGKTYDGITNLNGIVNLPVNIKKSGNYVVSVIFNGDDDYNPCVKTANIIVKKQKVKLTIKTKVLKLKSHKKIVKVKLTDQFNKAISKKLVKLTIDKKTYKVKTSSKGIASFKVKLMNKKVYKIKIRFGGDNSYKSLTKSGKILVK